MRQRRNLLSVDVTSSFQEAIFEAAKKNRAENLESRKINFELKKGDYPLQSIQIPRDSILELSSKDRARIIHIGKRNRPLFQLQENSELILKEKVEIYYNTNNIQEVMKLMIKCPPSCKVDVSKEVKISLFSYKPPGE